jgi:hypothetical protein
MKTMISNLKRTGLAVLAGLWLCATGCQSFKNSEPDYLTWVTITNRPMMDVTNATVTVFTTHGFTGGPISPGQFIFRRPGSAADQIAYGSYVVQQAVTVRTQVTVQQTTPDSILVGCNSWLVKSENNPTFEESYPVRAMRNGPYEDLLREIQKQLGQ